MTFTVTYRGADGALREESIEAASRTECFAHAKARSIRPLSVREGEQKNGRSSQGERPSRAQARSGSNNGSAVAGYGGSGALLTWRGAVLVAVAVAIACGAWFWLSAEKGRRRPKAQQTPPRVATDSSAVRKTKIPEVMPAAPSEEQTLATNDVESVKPKKRNLAKEIADARRAIQATNGYVRTKKETPFKTAADQAMAMLMSIPPGQAVPPIPLRPGAEEEFAKMVDTPIVILDTDSEKVKALKESVQACRQELKRLLDQGLSLQEIISEHRSLANENAQIRRDAAREAKEILESGNREDAENYVKTINAALSEMGIPLISMPMTREERHRQALERIAEKKRKAEERNKVEQ